MSEDKQATGQTTLRQIFFDYNEAVRKDVHWARREIKALEAEVLRLKRRVKELDNEAFEYAEQLNTRHVQEGYVLVPVDGLEKLARLNAKIRTRIPFDERYPELTELSRECKEIFEQAGIAAAQEHDPDHTALKHGGETASVHFGAPCYGAGGTEWEK